MNQIVLQLSVTLEYLWLVAFQEFDVSMTIKNEYLLIPKFLLEKLINGYSMLDKMPD